MEHRKVNNPKAGGYMKQGDNPQSKAGGGTKQGDNPQPKAGGGS
jgi:hypothetical protein